MSTSKTLVAYFSYGGGTKKLARVIAKLLDADLLEVDAKLAYPADEKALADRTKAELEGELPEIVLDQELDLAAYDTVILGSPNWWQTLATPLLAFIKEKDLSGKTLTVFTSEAGKALEDLSDKLKELCPDNRVLRGLSVYEGSAQEEQIKSWLENIGLLSK